MKGLLLAGGYGTRLMPVTSSLSKHLLPVYDKPMIYYPLSTLMLAGIRDIAVITMTHQQPLYDELLGDGSQWGINLTYFHQDEARGIAEALVIAEDFIGDDTVCLALGDNIIYGHGVTAHLQNSAQLTEGATIFGYYVSDPERYGVVEFNSDGSPKSIIEKPQHFVSNYAVIGLYFYDNQVVDIAKQLKPSARGEFEISDVNQAYLERGQLRVEKIGRGIAWLDTGTHVSLLEAARFVEVLERRQSLKICCPEEVAWRMGFITTQQLRELANPLCQSGYGDYLLKVIDIDEHRKQ